MSGIERASPQASSVEGPLGWRAPTAHGAVGLSAKGPPAPTNRRHLLGTANDSGSSDGRGRGLGLGGPDCVSDRWRRLGRGRRCLRALRALGLAKARLRPRALARTWRRRQQEYLRADRHPGARKQTVLDCPRGTLGERPSAWERPSYEDHELAGAKADSAIARTADTIDRELDLALPRRRFLLEDLLQLQEHKLRTRLRRAEIATQMLSHSSPSPPRSRAPSAQGSPASIRKAGGAGGGRYVNPVETFRASKHSRLLGPGEPGSSLASATWSPCLSDAKRHPYRSRELAACLTRGPGLLRRRLRQPRVSGPSHAWSPRSNDGPRRTAVPASGRSPASPQRATGPWPAARPGRGLERHASSPSGSGRMRRQRRRLGGRGQPLRDGHHRQDPGTSNTRGERHAVPDRDTHAGGRCGR